MANIKVAVRVRPISNRELNRTGPEIVVRTERNEISLTNLKVSSSKAGDSRERTRRYGFDYCFDSSDPDAENYANQAKIYETLGQSVLDSLISGYNSCLVAYGQSASGKTYTMMGSKEDPGLTPRLCEGLFSRIEEARRKEKSYRVSVSYLEIYNDRVRDLLKLSVGGLRVREHPRLGPYVQGLTHHVVPTLGSLMSYVEEGTKARKTASTLLNSSSSRSHALLTVSLTEETPGVVSGGASSATPSVSASTTSASTTPRRNDSASVARGGSKLHLVDLAGSESAATCSGVHRLKEGANINKSLVALGNVISALAERGSTGSVPGRRFIPYRDSSLTWLLKDALGGNAATIMLATISPASGSYNETAHTLRFAQRAQSVVNRPVVNEDPVARIIRELRDEVARLKSLLLEKGVEPAENASCCCQRNEIAEPANIIEDQQEESVNDAQAKTEENEGHDLIDETNNVLPIRRFNSSEGLSTRDTNPSNFVRKFSSYEFLGSSRSRLLGCNYNQAQVTELNDDEDESVNEINEPVFVDIPTLVAVLIKPDNTLQESSTQIEEICSDEVQEDPIDAEYINSENDREIFEGTVKHGSIDQDERSSSVNSYHESVDADVVDNHLISIDYPSHVPGLRPREKGRFSKQDSIDVVTPPTLSNLHISKAFGSVEALQKKRDPIVSLQRSHTNLEKRSSAERAKKLNNIREIEDQKNQSRPGNIWRAIGSIASKEQLQRKGSNDSDKSSKESTNVGGAVKIKSAARKPSLEDLKRKTSKDSSSSSSKDEQILISRLARDKLLRRKSSLDQDTVPARSHTPIQRAKRADIVAAVTERLYSSRKQAEDLSVTLPSMSGTRSPPEGTDVKFTTSAFTTRSKLQDISRKMLSKRRRVCVDTQTENSRTIRVKDTGSLTEEIKVECQDAEVLTDYHQDCEVSGNRATPCLRVKEIATLTDKPRISIVRCRDVGSLANDLEDGEYEAHSSRDDSGILSDDPQNYVDGRPLCAQDCFNFGDRDKRRIVCADSSTNTVLLSPMKNSSSQTLRREVVERRSVEVPLMRDASVNYNAPARNSVASNNSEKNVISISVPDMINITIESTNSLESRIALLESVDSLEEKSLSVLKDKESQTEGKTISCEQTSGQFSFGDFFSKSVANQTDSKVFRIENIFQDPKVDSSRYERIHTIRQSRSERIPKKSVIFTKSLGTSYQIPSTRESATEMEKYACEKMGGCESFNRCPLTCSPGIMESVQYKQGCCVVSTTSQELSNSYEVSTLNSNTSICNGSVSKIYQESKLKSPSLIARLDTIKSLEHDYNFSDDSLDYNEENLLDEQQNEDIEKINDDKVQENFCPPDVVAQTKKDAKCLTHLEAENTDQSTFDDFEDSYVEFPKKKPAELASTKVHDYKSLILGTSQGIDINLDESTFKREHNLFSGKKKVSFSSANNSNEGIEQETEQRTLSLPEQTSCPKLKSIIKRKKRKNVSEPLEFSVQSNTDDTDESTPGDRLGPLMEDDISTCKGKSSKARLKDPKKVLSSTKHRSVNTLNESHSVENVVREEEYVDEEYRRNVLERYLNEAMIFMRNMNSINEYMSATNVFHKYLRNNRRRRCRVRNCRPREKDYVEYEGRRISLKDDTDKYLKQTKDEEIVDPTRSYERCLESLDRLESCISRINKQNDSCREKYCMDVESTGAKRDLASPSLDSKTLWSKEDYLTTTPRRRVPVERCSTSATTLNGTLFDGRTDLHEEIAAKSHDRSNRVESDDDIEKRIFDELMDVADKAGRMKYHSYCLPKMEERNREELNSGSYRTYSRLRERYYNVRPLLNSNDTLDPDTILSNGTYSDRLSGENSVESGAFSTMRKFLSDTRATDLRSVEGYSDDDTMVNISCGIDPGSRKVDWEGTNQEDDVSRRIKVSLGYPKRSLLTSLELSKVENSSSSDSRSARTESIGGVFHSRDKLKYPGSPRARFLELLNERRRIVESSRGTSAS